MTDAIELALIGDDSGQLNTISVWDIRNGTQLMQYRGFYPIDFVEKISINNFFLNRRWCFTKGNSECHKPKVSGDSK